MPPLKPSGRPLKRCGNVPKLYRMYVDERASLKRCAAYFHTTPDVIKRWLAEYEIPLRPAPSESTRVSRAVREILDMPYDEYNGKICTVPVAILECGHRAPLRGFRRKSEVNVHIKTMKCRVCKKE